MLLVYAALALGVCGLSRALTCSGATRSAAEAMGAAELRAFLGPVAPGMSLGTWTIVHIDPPRHGVLTLALRPASGPDVALVVTRLDPAGPRPLASTGSLAVYRAGPGAPAGSTPPDELAAAAALAAHLREREAVAPAPLDLFTPPPGPGAR